MPILIEFQVVDPPPQKFESPCPSWLKVEKPPRYARGSAHYLEVFGREVAGVLGTEADDGGVGRSPPWLDEIDCEAGLPCRQPVVPDYV